MMCSDCRIKMENITEKFNSTEQHIFGTEQNWNHYRCKECGKGKHEMAKEKIKILPGKELPAELETKMEKIREKQQELDLLNEYVKEIQNDENVKKLTEKRDKLNKELGEKIEELGLLTSMENATVLKQEIEELVKQLGEEIPQEIWGTDTFSKGKKDAIASKDGIFRILRSTRSERKIIPESFIEKYPIVTNELVKEGKIVITLKAAEEKLGKDKIEEVCIRTETHKFELDIRDGRNLPTN